MRVLKSTKLEQYGLKSWLLLMRATREGTWRLSPHSTPAEHSRRIFDIELGKV